MKFKALGCYSPNFFFKPVSCYRLKIRRRVFYLDLGYLNMKKIIEEDFKNLTIIISHNHVDHVLDLVTLAMYLRVTRRKLKNKIKVYMPVTSKGVNVYKLLKRCFSDLFVVKEINESKELKVDGIRFSFCKTVHKGESYAIKVEDRGKTFVYTSDLAWVSYKLIKFCLNADTILVEGGHAVYNNTPFGYYHGRTKDILERIDIASPKRVIVTHLEARVTLDKYVECFPRGTNTLYECITLGKEYLI